MGLLLVIYGFFNSTIGEKMNEIQIIEAVLKEARIKDVVPDLAENFLFSYPFVKNYLNIKGIKDHKGYIMDMLPK